MSVGPIAQRVLQRIGQQVRSKVVNLDAIREGNAYAEALQQSAIKPDNLKDMHPAHAIYTHAQNQMSVMAEQLLELRDMETFGKLISKAQDDYMPSWPPMSPVTTSFFWCWAGFDLSVNAHRETLGTIILAVGEEWNIHPTMLNWMRALQNSRMGVFRVESHAGRTVQLTDLVTTQGYTAVCNSGYNGRTGGTLVHASPAARFARSTGARGVHITLCADRAESGGMDGVLRSYRGQRFSSSSSRGT
jgi:hypothetical protein